MKLTIIGCGNIGGAIARGLKDSDIDLYCADKSSIVLDALKNDIDKIRTTTDNAEAVKDADIIVLSVKPFLIESVIEEIKYAMDYEKQIVISIAAKVEFEKLCWFFKKDDESLPPIFRIIPNTAIEVCESMNFISVYNATSEQTDTVKFIFDKLGLSMLIEERLLDAGMALASCGIAYAFRYIRAVVEGALELGIPSKLAIEIELQTLKGAIALLKSKNTHPEVEIDKVTTPGGITIKGLNTMESFGFSNAVIKGLKAGR